MPEREKIEKYWLENAAGFRVGLINLGASITHIVVPDNEGQFENVVLNHSDFEEYRNNEAYLGVTVGRYANRIAYGIVSHKEKTYQLTINEKAANNHLHGGKDGFSRKKWNVIKNDKNGIAFQYNSPDEEEGYPGNVAVTVHYSIDDDYCLTITYKAVADQPTILNLTNHSYFNLSGGYENIFNHNLSIKASEFTPLNERNLPEGYKCSVKGKIYDLENAKKVSEIAGSIINTNYCIDNSEGLTASAILTHPASGRRLKVFSTLPGLQLYFGSFLSGQHHPFDGICLEPQYFPNAPNISAFGYMWLDKGSLYEEKIVYRFDTI